MADGAQSAEYKQVTVLFADVVHSMDIAAAVGAERLREIMAELVERSTVVVKRYGGTVNQFTGDGIMAIYGAPAALEDHAFRACLAALAIQEVAKPLAADVRERDGKNLRLRVGLNSGRVIAGEIGSGALGYTTIGEQVGMAQRMESVAPPGGVMLSESTARLVEHAAMLAQPEMVQIKGGAEAVRARRLLGVALQHEISGAAEAALVGRDLEVTTIAGLLDRSGTGRGCVVCVAGPAGIGKTRLVRETMRLATSRGVEAFSTYCESHATDIAFHSVARLLRAATGVSGLNDEDARARLRAQAVDADDEDLVLLHDLLGISDPDVALPKLDPDARRRRLTALINSLSLARTEPALYVIEDAHWIDEVSESMFAEFLSVIPQTPAVVLITYRPEYLGALAQVKGAQTISLAPLSDSETAVLLDELLGPDPSVLGLRAVVAERAAGNPFFAQEMVRELAERGVLQGDRGRYTCQADVAEITVPATLQATIAARIDRLDPDAKQTLNAAAVIGSRFTPGLLNALGNDPAVGKLLTAELVDQIRFMPSAEFAFRHPLIRTVAYESQLKSDRAELHRRLAGAIQQRDPASLDENAALIAEHLEAARDLVAAFDWHMRAGAWSYIRDVAAARLSWERARRVADALPHDHFARLSMRIAPRTLLSGSSWRVGSGVDTGFDELRDLCVEAGDQRSLAIGMTGLVMKEFMNGHTGDGSRLATEHSALLESIRDPALAVGLSFAALAVKHEAGAMTEVLRLAERVIELAGGDSTMGSVVFGSPLSGAIVFRGCARWCLGQPGWKEDLAHCVAMARATDATSLAGVTLYKYVLAIPCGALLPDANALRETADALTTAERSGDGFALLFAQMARGITLVHGDGLDREAGFALLAAAREAALRGRFTLTAVPPIDLLSAKEEAGSGDLDGAVERTRSVAEYLFSSGNVWSIFATTCLVEMLLRRGGDADIEDAQAAIDRLAAQPFGLALNEITLLRLRTLLAHAHGDEATYHDYRGRYREMATALGFDGHMKWAEAMA
ncbi:adenylate/guanylate cyclase domain-containing protein [Mycobacterium sp. ITM-2016-00318]|nr:adenylate/guanylate cyclase domain-containing protein [Mycobacterium sp. ITM-2016-00318]WNG94070.1 adenylate/guanylate cyclase domain-containing protein [Mycobacterium sp. ITM-2016-00318]